MYKFYEGKFYPYFLKGEYEASGSWPGHGVDVSQDVFSEFTSQPPFGKRVGSGEDGYPCWVDIPARPNDQLLHDELQVISNQYKLDINELNQAYLAATVSDGPGEVAKQAAVRSAIDERKAQYVADKAAARDKYPV